jgi:hypothetical protein
VRPGRLAAGYVLGMVAAAELVYAGRLYWRNTHVLFRSLAGRP